MTSLDFSGKTVLIIRALWEQKPLIRAANHCGAQTVAIDEKEDAEGLEHADTGIVVDSLRDVAACLAVAKEHDIDAVVTDECDYSLFTAAYIGHRLGLPATDLAAVQLTTHKGRLRDYVENFVSQPAYDRCTTLTEVNEAIASINYPAIIKPVDSRGAFGVSRIKSIDDLEDGYLDAVANSPGREVIVEDFIYGTPLTVEGYFIDDTHQTFVIGKKNTPLGNLDPNREIVYPASLSEADRDRVTRMNDEIAASLPSSFGPTHAEYILPPEGDPQLLEFHNRGGGIHISAKIVRELTSFDVNQQLLADSFGVEMGQQPKLKTDDVVIVHPVTLPAGTLQSVDHQKEVHKMESVRTFRLYVEPGDRLENPKSPVDAHGLLIVSGPSEEAARREINRVYDTIEPRTVN